MACAFHWKNCVFLRFMMILFEEQPIYKMQTLFLTVKLFVWKNVFEGSWTCKEGGEWYFFTNSLCITGNRAIVQNEWPCCPPDYND